VENDIIDADAAKQARETARQKAIEARRKALADPMPDGSTVEAGVYAD
jgi:TPP-dependent pyruvate/acetoin dehydrogenase alpha subunit